MQSLGLDVKVLSGDNEEIELREALDVDGISSIENMIDMEAASNRAQDEFFAEDSGFSEEKTDDEAEEDMEDTEEDLDDVLDEDDFDAGLAESFEGIDDVSDEDEDLF